MKSAHFAPLTVPAEHNNTEHENHSIFRLQKAHFIRIVSEASMSTPYFSKHYPFIEPNMAAALPKEYQFYENKWND